MSKYINGKNLLIIFIVIAVTTTMTMAAGIPGLLLALVLDLVLLAQMTAYNSETIGDPDCYTKGHSIGN